MSNFKKINIFSDLANDVPIIRSDRKVGSERDRINRTPPPQAIMEDSGDSIDEEALGIVTNQGAN